MTESEYHIERLAEHIKQCKIKHLTDYIAAFEKTLAGWVDEHPNVHPVLMKASKDAVISQLADLKKELDELTK